MPASDNRQTFLDPTDAGGGEPSGMVQTGRALVPLTLGAPAQEAVASRRQSPFLAQLLAARDRHPQACERRRVAPGEAIAAYQAGAALMKRH